MDAVILTGVGKRYDIVSAFAQHAFTIAADPSPLAPARYAADLHVFPPRIDDPEYAPFLQALVEEHGVTAVVPLTDLDIEVLSRSGLPAFVPTPDVCRDTYDKFATHELLLRHGLPSPPTVLPGEEVESFPVMVKPRQGSGARSIHPAADAREMDFFISYVKEPVMIQRLMGGPEFSIDLLCDMDGRCLNAIPRTMIESRGGESIKGTVIHDEDLIELGRAVAEALPVRGPCTVQAFRDPEIGLGITDVNTRFGGAFPAPMYAARHGRTYPELIVRMARGEQIEPHVGEFDHGHTFTRWFWQTELDSDLEPTGRDIVPDGPRAPRRSRLGVVRAALACWVQSHHLGEGFDRARPLMAVDVEWVEDPSWPGYGEYKGVEDVGRYLQAQMDEVWESMDVEIDAVEDAGGDRVLSLLSATARSKAGTTTQLKLGHIWFVRDGLVRRVEWFLDQDRARAAAT